MIKQFFLTAIVACGISTTASAAIALSMTPSSQNVSPGGTGYELAFAIDTTSMGVIELSGFNVTVTVPDSSGITFTGGDSSVANYVFAGDSAGLQFLDPGIVGTNGADISDFPGLALSTNLPGGVYGLGRIFFDVAPGAPLGTTNITLDVATSFTDDLLTNISFTPVGGTTIGSVSAVPEPSSLTLLMAGGVTVGIIRRKRKQWESKSDAEPTTA